jgi:hypothetical protein
VDKKINFSKINTDISHGITALRHTPALTKGPMQGRVGRKEDNKEFILTACGLKYYFSTA